MVPVTTNQMTKHLQKRSFLQGSSINRCVEVLKIHPSASVTLAPGKSNGPGGDLRIFEPRKGPQKSAVTTKDLKL